MGARNDQATVDRLAALGIDTSATIRAAAGDVVQRLVALRVQKRIQEAEDRLAGAQTGIVQ